jgi:small subunit ribosomal protein S2
MKDLESGAETGEFEAYTKKEQLLMSREREKLAKNLAGIKTMTRLPGLMFVVDSKKERIAVNEANKLGIPIVAIVDTNADPDLITVPVAGNDDAIRSVELIARSIADEIIEARQAAPKRVEAEEGEAQTYSTERGMESTEEGDKRRRRRPRRRRAKPEAIAARLKGHSDAAEGGEGGEGGETAGEGGGAGGGESGE